MRILLFGFIGNDRISISAFDDFLQREFREGDVIKSKPSNQEWGPSVLDGLLKKLWVPILKLGALLQEARLPRKAGTNQTGDIGDNSVFPNEKQVPSCP